jgi:hypothetical protein
MSVWNKATSSIRERNPSAGLIERRTASTRGIISTSRARHFQSLLSIRALRRTPVPLLSVIGGQS